MKNISREKLSLSEQTQLLETLPGWAIRDEKLRREYKFESFRAAFAFLTQVAFVSEKFDHHPILKNCYGAVELEIWTHTARGITELDFAWAKEIDLIRG